RSFGAEVVGIRQSADRNSRRFADTESRGVFDIGYQQTAFVGAEHRRIRAGVALLPAQHRVSDVATLEPETLRRDQFEYSTLAHDAGRGCLSGIDGGVDCCAGGAGY